MSDKTILLEIKDKAAYLTLNRPELMNAMNPQMKHELDQALTRIEWDSGIWGVIITGSGRAFSAGTDISEFPETVEQARQITAYSQRLFDRIEALEKPVIAAVNGFALGGGLELALCCDIRIADERAKLGFPQVKICAIPCYGGTQRLPRLIGEGRAKEMIYTGEMVRADQALAWGMVDHVVPAGQAVQEAEALLGRILHSAPMAVSYAKQCINGGLTHGIAHGLESEKHLVSMLVATHDMEEGTRAFLEKREPVFQNR